MGSQLHATTRMSHNKIKRNNKIIGRQPRQTPYSRRDTTITQKNVASFFGILTSLLNNDQSFGNKETYTEDDGEGRRRRQSSSEDQNVKDLYFYHHKRKDSKNP